MTSSTICPIKLTLYYIFENINHLWFEKKTYSDAIHFKQVRNMDFSTLVIALFSLLLFFERLIYF